MNQSVADIACKLRVPRWAATAGDIPVRLELALNQALPFLGGMSISSGNR